MTSVPVATQGGRGVPWAGRPPADHVNFRILGPLEVTGGSGTVAFGGRREGVLLARLLLSANRVVSSERLVDDLWASDPPGDASGALQAYVSRLRRALRGCGIDDVLATRSPGYVLQVDPNAFDAACFESMVAQGREALARGKYQAAAEALRMALTLWRGSALADVGDVPFARAEGVRLEEGRVAALEERIEADLACGRHGELIGELPALVSEHPLRERLWSQRMLTPPVEVRIFLAFMLRDLGRDEGGRSARLLEEAVALALAGDDPYAAGHSPGQPRRSMRPRVGRIRPGAGEGRVAPEIG